MSKMSNEEFRLIKARVDKHLENSNVFRLISNITSINLVNYKFENINEFVEKFVYDICVNREVYGYKHVMINTKDNIALTPIEKGQYKSKDVEDFNMIIHSVSKTKLVEVTKISKLTDTPSYDFFFIFNEYNTYCGLGDYQEQDFYRYCYNNIQERVYGRNYSDMM